MKSILILSLVILSQTLAAQTISAKLSGDWTAQCITEKVKKDRVEVCKICPIQSTDEEIVQVFKVEINFGEESISFNYPTGKRTVAIRYDEKSDHLTFKMDGVAYDFSVMSIDQLNKIILKNQNGTLIYLERKNIMKTN
jgi:hypothetical protein